MACGAEVDRHDAGPVSAGLGLKAGTSDLTATQTAWPGSGFVVWWLECGQLRASRDTKAPELAAGAWGLAAGGAMSPWMPASGVRLQWFALPGELAWSSRASAWLWRTAQLRPVVAARPLSAMRRAWWMEAGEELAAGESDGVVWLEVEAMLWRLERELPVVTLLPGATRKRTETAGTARADARVDAMVRHLVRHAQEHLTVEAVCRAVGLPAAHGAALFRRITGLPMLTYLRRVRVAQACALLAGTPRKVLDVALSSGFGTASRFYEAFQREAGCSPQEYRRRIAAGEGPVRRAASLESAPPDHRLLPASDLRGALSATGREGGSPVVLWVDDAPANNFDERRFLHEIGVFTDCHLDNASALAALATRRHALVISDLNRPPGQATGWELLATLRAGGDHTPVLFYTGAVDRDLESRARAGGGQGVFARSRPLIERVLELLGGGGSGSAVAAVS